MKLATVEDTGVAIRAVLQNGHSLVQDAELLFGNGRYPRAYALAHLACEEFAKIPILFAVATSLFKNEPIDWQTVGRRFRSHSAKAFQHLAVRSTMVEAPIKDGVPDFESVLLKIRDDGRLLPSLKNLALYVEISDSQVQTPDMAITKEIAAGAIEAAHDVRRFYVGIQLSTLDRIATDIDPILYEQLRLQLVSLVVSIGESETSP